MTSSDDDDQMLNKVEDILAVTAPDHVVCQLCDEVIREGCKSLSVGLFGCKTLDKRCWAALMSLQQLTLENRDMKAKVERCRLSDMDKFTCIGSLCGRMTITGAVMSIGRKPSSTSPRWSSFSLVKRVSGVLMLDKESFLAYQKAKAKWKSALASHHVHREKVEGGEAGRCAYAHRDSPRAQHRHRGKDQREDWPRGQDDRETAVLRSL